jgi:hypothetical protein
MVANVYHLIDLASDQLETAIALMISGQDRFSIITLAAAADGILSQLVKNNGEECFTATPLKEDDSHSTLGSMGKDINELLHINDLKHMDEGDSGYVTMDVEQCAVAAILKAVANFVKLQGDKVEFVQAMLAWVKLNLDPAVYNVNCDPDWKSNRAPDN